MNEESLRIIKSKTPLEADLTSAIVNELMHLFLVDATLNTFNMEKAFSQWVDKKQRIGFMTIAGLKIASKRDCDSVANWRIDYWPVTDSEVPCESVSSESMLWRL